MSYFDRRLLKIGDTHSVWKGILVYLCKNACKAPFLLVWVFAQHSSSKKTHGLLAFLLSLGLLYENILRWMVCNRRNSHSRLLDGCYWGRCQAMLLVFIVRTRETGAKILRAANWSGRIMHEWTIYRTEIPRMKAKPRFCNKTWPNAFSR